MDGCSKYEVVDLCHTGVYDRLPLSKLNLLCCSWMFFYFLKIHNIYLQMNFFFAAFRMGFVLFNGMEQDLVKQSLVKHC